MIEQEAHGFSGIEPAAEEKFELGHIKINTEPNMYYEEQSSAIKVKEQDDQIVVLKPGIVRLDCRVEVDVNQNVESDNAWTIGLFHAYTSYSFEQKYPSGSLRCEVHPLKSNRFRAIRSDWSDTQLEYKIPIGRIQKRTLDLSYSFDPTPVKALCVYENKRLIDISYDEGVQVWLVAIKHGNNNNQPDDTYVLKTFKWSQNFRVPINMANPLNIIVNEEKNIQPHTLEAPVGFPRTILLKTVDKASTFSIIWCPSDNKPRTILKKADAIIVSCLDWQREMADDNIAGIVLDEMALTVRDSLVGIPIINGRMVMSNPGQGNCYCGLFNGNTIPNLVQ